MAIRIAPPVLRAEDPDSVDIGRLRRIVAGERDALPRSAAIRFLAASDFPGRLGDLGAVLSDEGETVRIRAAAAWGLARVGSDEALAVLGRECRRARDPTVLNSILTALGRIGGRKSLKAIERAQRNATGPSAERAAFAASLIAHRLGLEGYDLAPQARTLKVAPECARLTRQERADRQDVQRALEAFGRTPWSLELSATHATRIRCEAADWIVLLTSTAAAPNALERLRDKKAAVGVVFRRDGLYSRYAATLLVLTSPTEDQIAVHCPTCTGKPFLVGRMRITRASARFILRSVAFPGVFPVEIRGVFRPENGLTFGEIRAFDRVLRSREPAEGRSGG